MNQPSTLPLDTAPIGTLVAADDALWYKDAVVYQLNVKAFYDSNGDGVGDFKGVTQKLDYVKELGVNTIWLMPFYPSPLRDDGYDISDYDDINPQYGTLADFKEMLAEAHKRDLRVITELVINHTSDQHPWFQEARKAPPGSPERDMYVWSDTDDKYRGTRIIFTDTEKSNWTYDPVAKAFFWHRFFSHQPDLNFDNPLVLERIFTTMRSWLDMGVDGFRLDAIPYLVEREGTNNENLPETHAVIKQIRAAIDAGYKNRFLLAEANQWPEDVSEYFGDGDECQACYHFPMMPRMYMSIAQEDRFPMIEIMAQTPEIPPNCQWAIFLRNHDELTLEMVTSKERDYLWTTYAADPRARINVGIRRRLAPLMDNDTDRIKLMNSMLLSMRGSPIIYNGDEIGMGDNFFIGDRNGVRTPMQWSNERNAGFSRADPQRLYLQPIMDSVYGYEGVNVESQMREPASLLNWMRRMLQVRNSSKAFGRGEIAFLHPGNRKILAYLRTLGDEAILCVANLARSAQPVELDLAAFKGRVPVELLGRTAFPPIGDLPYLMTLPAHGFYWFRLATDVPVPSWHQEMKPAEDRPVLVLFDGWTSLFRDHVVPWRIGLAVKTRNQYETDTLPRYLVTQRWYGGYGKPLQRARLIDQAIWEDGRYSWLLQLVDTDGASESATYFVPLALAWEDREEERMRAISPAAVARVRQQAEVGVMGDAFADEVFCRALIAAIASRKDLATADGTIRFRPTAAFSELAGSDIAELPVGRPETQSSNSTVTIGQRLFLKGYRRPRVGVNPEFEVGRFLTDVAQFPNCVPLAGTVDYVAKSGATMTLALVQAYVENQGNGWAYTLNYLERFLEMQRTSTEVVPPDVHGAYLALMDTLGRRTAELHLALSRTTGDSAFDPQPITTEDLSGYRGRVQARLRSVFAALEARLPRLPAPAQDDARAVLALRDPLLARIEQARLGLAAGAKIRVHGEYHLSQVLLAKNDFVIVDFEGETTLAFDERRVRQSPLSDVAGLLRSLGAARETALRSSATTEDELVRLQPLAAQWETESRNAFLRAYGLAAAGGALALDGEPLQDDAGQPRGLLALFELEQTLHELGAELEHRPEGVRTPLQGILAMAARP